MPEPKYKWDKSTRQFRNETTGRFVSRDDLRRTVDAYVERVRQDIRSISERLRDGKINLSQWQTEMEQTIKRAHAAAGSIGSGGWKQATQKQWGYIGSNVREQYGFLRRRTLQLEAGLPLDDDFISKSMGYGTSALRSYEGTLRRLDIDSGKVVWEWRVQNSAVSCKSCGRYAAMGKQKPGVLPDLGVDCECGSFCRCEFKREFRK